MLAPVAVAVPVLAAAVILVANRRIPRVGYDIVATATAVSVVGMAAALLQSAVSGRVVTWSGGWVPHRDFSVGIVLVVDPLGAGAALVAASLVTLSLVFSWRYVEAEEGHYHCLVLLFLAGMEGFALTGDLFDMFVFFELMGAAAYALTGMKVEDPTSLQGGMNFGIINSLGAYVALMGVGFVYSKTGQLGMAQLGRAVAHQPKSAVLVAAFVMLMAGFLVKGALAPFHFWLADAHGVAPSPVCVLFSGIMVPLGVYGAFRVYWIVFSSAIDGADVRRAFLVLGVVTALVGAVMCLSQRNFKRMLAYSTIAHVGLFVIALGTLTPSGTAGAAIYIVSHAGVKGALFMVGGVLLGRYGTVDEAELHGRAVDLRWIRWLAVLGGLGLACMPPFGTALGKAVGEEAASAAGYPWVTALFVGVSAMTGGAVLRVCGRIFFGLGPRPIEDDSQTTGDEEREGEPLGRVPPTMVAPVVILLCGALAVGVVPGVHAALERAAEWFSDPAGYRQAAMSGKAPAVPAVHVSDWSASGILLGLLSAVLGVAVAAAGVWSAALRRRATWLERPTPALDLLRRLHSGHVGDYVAWFMLGLAVLGGFVGLPRR